FTREEVRTGKHVAIISERLVSELDLAAPLGAPILTDDSEWEVVGVARNASYSSLTRPMPVTYVPLKKGTGSVTVLLRTTANPLAVVGAAREVIRLLDSNVPLV